MSLPPALVAELEALGFGAGFVPPPEVAAAAAEGLRLRALHKRGGTAVGLARAESLTTRRRHSAHEMRLIAGWFARFGYLHGRAGWDNPAAPSTGYIAWMLWGGDAGRAWVERLRPEWRRAALSARNIPRGSGGVKPPV